MEPASPCYRCQFLNCDKESRRCEFCLKRFFYWFFVDDPYIRTPPNEFNHLPVDKQASEFL
jgi:hypothetical protein